MTTSNCVTKIVIQTSQSHNVIFKSVTLSRDGLSNILGECLFQSKVVVPRYGDYAEAFDMGIVKYYRAAGQVCVNLFQSNIGARHRKCQSRK